jgi:hypothetical protein
MANEELSYSTPDRLVQDFASRGLVLLSPESLGLPMDIHDRIYQQEKQAHDARQPISPGLFPDVLDILNSPGLVSACNQLVGDNWAIVPFTHNASFISGARDQHWHKDDNGPYNGRKQRHHQAVQLEMLYYPQAVRPDMGPTATVPYSHYWTFNHEENHDNFAGADHLDFNYQIDGMERRPVSGPDSEYDVEDIRLKRTAHDIRMREAVTDLKWPLVQQLEAAPLRAGTVLIYSHNTFHRGNHRRDDWRTWPDNPRFMWRFWLYRTTEPAAPNGVSVAEIDWRNAGLDPLTRADLGNVSDDVSAVWRYHVHWLHSGQSPPPRPEVADLSKAQREQEAEHLFAQLHEKNDAAEPTRIGAAYKLASIGDTALAVHHLGKALYTDRESVRRAATYGLIAVGPDATHTLLEATSSPLKWVRKAGVYALGDASPLTDEVLQAIVGCLEGDASVYVRAVAAGTLGCLGRRAAATGVGKALIPHCLDALVQSLAREPNRLGMDRAQGRSVKFARPTDDCDVCEGNGVDFGFERFGPVRSAVRENALWSVVILCSHGASITSNALEPTIAALREVIGTDQNVICVGFAMDALNRLANLNPDGDATPSIKALRDTLPATLKESPIRPWEALVRGGLNSGSVADFE